MKVFYRKEQVGPVQKDSPSAHKPALVVDDWIKTFGEDIEVCSFEPIVIEDLLRVHEPSFVAGVMLGTIANGFGNKDLAVANSLLYTSGSMLAAARYAVEHKTVACSPTSGFHHAEYDRNMGFCTFNGLMVAAVALKEAGLVNKVAILDCDAHYGNGTDSIIAKLGIDWIKHHTQGRFFGSRLDAANGSYMKWLNNAIDDCLDCDLVIYQAGADPHVDDPYGGVLTTQELSERDRTVFERLGHHMPIAWNLAGGYQRVAYETDPAKQIEPVLALHRETVNQYIKIMDYK
jgi:acetoin utilization deacetylase AcuC-like enzyme